MNEHASNSIIDLKVQMFISNLNKSREADSLTKLGKRDNIDVSMNMDSASVTDQKKPIDEKFYRNSLDLWVMTSKIKSR